MPQSRISRRVNGSRTRAWRYRGTARDSAAQSYESQRVSYASRPAVIENVAPRLEEIEGELAALTEVREKRAGTVRITTTEHAAYTIIWPKLKKVLPQYPDIKVEIIIEQALTDIVAARYDAGVRLGGQVAKDMIALRIGPDARMAVVGAP